VVHMKENRGLISRVRCYAKGYVALRYVAPCCRLVRIFGIGRRGHGSPWQWIDHFSGGQLPACGSLVEEASACVLHPLRFVFLWL
jgi:hypothetical protein